MRNQETLHPRFMWVSEEGRVQGHAYAICVIKDTIHLRRGLSEDSFVVKLIQGGHVSVYYQHPPFEYPILNPYLPLAFIFLFYNFLCIISYNLYLYFSCATTAFQTIHF